MNNNTQFSGFSGTSGINPKCYTGLYISTKQSEYKPRLALMCGVSGSGKSTWVKAHAWINGYLVLSSDNYRQHILGDINSQEHNFRVFNWLQDTCKYLLYEKSNVLIDATNTTVKSRKSFIDIGMAVGADIYVYVLKTTAEDCRTRNSERERKVPEHVIKRQLSQYQQPTIKEGISNIIYV